MIKIHQKCQVSSLCPTSMTSFVFLLAEDKGELQHSFLMLGFRTPVMAVAFNSMAVIVTGAAQQRKGMKEVLPLD